MKFYSPSEVADLLKIKQPTLRKYSIMLEERGYDIGRNSQNHRYYRDEDVITLRRVMAGSKSGVTLDKSIDNVLSVQGLSAYTNDANNGNEAHGNEMKEIKKMMQEQSELIYKQNDLIKGLTDRLDQQQDYINNTINERDKVLMSTLNEVLETKKQIAATEEKKGFFAKLFGKSQYD